MIMNNNENDKVEWYIDENGNIGNNKFISLPPEPFVDDCPDTVWRIDPDINSGFPFNALIPIEPPSGAFMNATKLLRAEIPRSCKKIGRFAFANTALKKVKIAADCEYFSSSFPKDCEVEFYGEGGSFGQLYDSDGYAILDADSTRIYVKE